MHDCMQTNVLVLQQPSVLVLPTAQCASLCCCCHCGCWKWWSPEYQ